jgi:hypothetical protein
MFIDWLQNIAVFSAACLYTLYIISIINQSIVKTLTCSSRTNELEAQECSNETFLYKSDHNYINLTTTNINLTRTDTNLTRTNINLIRTDTNLTRTNINMTRANINLTRTNINLTRTNVVWFNSGQSPEVRYIKSKDDNHNDSSTSNNEDYVKRPAKITIRTQAIIALVTRRNEGNNSQLGRQLISCQISLASKFAHTNMVVETRLRFSTNYISHEENCKNLKL